MAWKVTELLAAPFADGKPIKFNEARMSRSGFEIDRAWVITDSEGNRLSRRDHPEFGTIRALTSPDYTFFAIETGRGNFETLEIPHASGSPHPTIVVSRKFSCLGYDQGPQVSQWLEKNLPGIGCSLHLVRLDPASLPKDNERHLLISTVRARARYLNAVQDLAPNQRKFDEFRLAPNIVLNDTGDTLIDSLAAKKPTLECDHRGITLRVTDAVSALKNPTDDPRWEGLRIPGVFARVVRGGSGGRSLRKDDAFEILFG